MTQGKTRRTDEHCVTWLYAGACFNALRDGNPLPPIPQYTIWEISDNRPDKIVGFGDIVPARVSYGVIKILALSNKGEFL